MVNCFETFLQLDNTISLLAKCPNPQVSKPRIQRSDLAFRAKECLYNGFFSYD